VDLGERGAQILRPVEKIEASKLLEDRAEHLAPLGDGFGMKQSAKFSRRAVNSIAWLVAVIVLLSASSLVYAQGCAMCYTSAAASKAGALQALRSGILILLLPVLAMCSGISVVIYRSRNRFLGGADSTAAQDRELYALFTRMDAGALEGRAADEVPSGAGGPSAREHFDGTPGGTKPLATDDGRPQVQL
jgi:hypothetical protein